MIPEAAQTIYLLIMIPEAAQTIYLLIRAQASWCARNPDYFTARRIQSRQAAERPPEPLRLPRPLSALPWDIAQDEFGAQGADFLGVMGTLILGAAQDEILAYLVDSTRDPGPLPRSP
jgi:hypothetical protein